MIAAAQPARRRQRCRYSNVSRKPIIQLGADGSVWSAGLSYGGMRRRSTPRPGIASSTRRTALVDLAFCDLSRPMSARISEHAGRRLVAPVGDRGWPGGRARPRRLASNGVRACSASALAAHLRIESPRIAVVLLDARESGPSVDVGRKVCGALSAAGARPLLVGALLAPHRIGAELRTATLIRLARSLCALVIESSAEAGPSGLAQVAREWTENLVVEGGWATIGMTSPRLFRLRASVSWLIGSCVIRHIGWFPRRSQAGSRSSLPRSRRSPSARGARSRSWRSWPSPTDCPSISPAERARSSACLSVRMTRDLRNCRCWRYAKVELSDNAASLGRIQRARAILEAREAGSHRSSKRQPRRSNHHRRRSREGGSVTLPCGVQS